MILFGGNLIQCQILKEQDLQMLIIETLIWAAQGQVIVKYDFNYQAMKSLNDGILYAFRLGNTYLFW